MSGYTWTHSNVVFFNPDSAADNRIYFKRGTAWAPLLANTDFGNEIITAQFADGVYVRSGNIKSGNYTVITVTQKYGGVKNVTLTADLTSSGYAVYARNANDGSNYNGAISLYVFAAK